MHELERIKTLGKSVAVDRQVPVAQFHGLGAQPGATGDARKSGTRA
jgi:hypothetical protein